MHIHRSTLIVSLALLACNGLDLSDNFIETTSSETSWDTPSTTSSSAASSSAGATASATSTTGSNSSDTISDTTLPPIDTTTWSDSPTDCTAPPSRASSLVFVTPYPFPGDLSLENVPDALREELKSRLRGSSSQLNRADRICQFFAEKITQKEHPGHFVAWLSTPSSSVLSFLDSNQATATNRHFIRLDSTCIANSWGQWLSSTHAAPVAPQAAPIPNAWTGTKEDGTSTDSHCVNWTSKDAKEFGDAGTTSAYSQGWSYTKLMDLHFACDTPHHLYCLQYAD